MDLGFVVRGSPGGEGSGAVQSATRLMDGLVDFGHGVHVYSTAVPSEAFLDRALVSFDRIEVDGGMTSETSKITSAIGSMREKFESHDVVHFYHPSDVYSAGRLGSNDVQTVLTMQAYGGICPKNDLMYRNERSCSGNGYLKCTVCGMFTNEGGIRGFGDAKRTLKRGVGHGIDARLLEKASRKLDEIGAFHTYADHVKNRYVRSGYPAGKISVVRSIVDDGFVIPHESDFEEPYELLFAGRLSREKGVHLLVPIVEKLRESDYEFELTVAGTGNMDDRIREQIDTCGLHDCVDLRGHVPYEQMPGEYAAHDVFLSPGMWEEPFGRVYLEAMATGTPVVSTDVGEVKETLGDSGVVAQASTEALCEAILTVVDDDRLSEMSAAGKENVRVYEKDRIVPRMESLYREVTSGDAA